MPRTLYDKIWNDHVVHQQDDGTALLYVDRHLVHEVTSLLLHELNAYQHIIMLFHHPVDELRDHSKFCHKEFGAL